MLNSYISFESALAFFTTVYVVSVMILLIAANTALVVIEMIEEFDNCT